MINKGLRNFLINGGVILGWASSGFIPTFRDLVQNDIVRWSMFIISFIFIFSGCYIWTKLKKRHWAFMLWGILSPIGLLGISLLKDKSINKQSIDNTIEE